MRAGQRIAVIVPALDEARHIARTLRGIPAWVDHVLVVDDGSRDDTAARAQAAARGDGRIEVLRHARNLGVGAALATGYRAALHARADVAVVMAGDDQMDPRDLPRLLRPVLDGDADYAKGDRLAHPHVRRSMPRTRLIGNHVLSWLTRVALGLRVRDSQCGYTAASTRALSRLPLEALWPRYGYPNDLLAWLAQDGARIVDVPVRAVYGREVSGIGLRHALAVIPFVIARATLRRLSPTPAARLRPLELESE